MALDVGMMELCTAGGALGGSTFGKRIWNARDCPALCPGQCPGGAGMGRGAPWGTLPVGCAGISPPLLIPAQPAQGHNLGVVPCIREIPCASDPRECAGTEPLGSWKRALNITSFQPPHGSKSPGTLENYR